MRMKQIRLDRLVAVILLAGVLSLTALWLPRLVSANGLTISSKTPDANALDVALSSNIVVEFSTNINGTTVTANTFNVDGSLSDNITGTYSVVSDNVTFNPDSDFKVGETVTVTLTTGIHGASGEMLTNPVTWQFMVEAPQGYGYFEDSGQSLGEYESEAVALGDVDGDGDLDAVLANGPYHNNKVLLNNGSGNFTYSGQDLVYAWWSMDVALGDVDGDGDLDAVFANYVDPNKVWLNDSYGVFTDSGQEIGHLIPETGYMHGFYSHGVALGDVDGDGDLDTVFANDYSPNNIWLNDGSGNFTDSGGVLGTSHGEAVAMGDFDGDGDLDVFIANVYNTANKVWRNDGNGNFTDSGQELGSSSSFGVALGDVDGDGDLDAFVANSYYIEQPNKLWLNDGSGTFTDSGQELGSSRSDGVALGDLDDDGDLDAFVANWDSQPNKVWHNDGSGNFTDSGQELGSSNSLDERGGKLHRD